MEPSGDNTIQDVALNSKNDSQYMSFESMDDIKNKNPKSDNKSMNDDEEENKVPEDNMGEEHPPGNIFNTSDKDSDTIYFHSNAVMGKMFIIPRKYQIIKAVGKGSYGLVCKATNTETNELVAIKKMLNPFKIPGQIIRILREIRLLKFLDHENIIQIKDLFPAVSIKNFESIYIVSEFVSSDLMQIIHSDNSLTEDHIQFILFQILSALKYLHSANIIHRDLKPSNILINEDCEIKICDFGLARAMQTKVEGNSDMTVYVTTRIYRAPELLFQAGEYSTKIDVWSIGCIFAEMLIRRPLFMTKNMLKHVSMIVSLVGTEEELNAPCFASFKDKIKHLNITAKPEETFYELFKSHSDEARDLLRKMLQLDPDKRITIDEALHHPYFANYEDELEDLENCTRVFDASFEDLQHNQEQLKNEVLKEIFSFSPNLSDDQFSRQNTEYKFLRRSAKVHNYIK